MASKKNVQPELALDTEMPKVNAKGQLYATDVRPPKDYVLKTDIIAQIQKKNKEKDLSPICNVVIDKDMAWDLLTLNIDNRNPTYADIDRYATDMKSKRWFFLGNAFKVDKQGRLFDGQKELIAIIKSDTKQMFHIQCYLEPLGKFVTDTGRNRSLADALRDAGFADANNLASAIRAIIAFAKFQRSPGNVPKGMKADNQTVVDWTRNKTKVETLRKMILAAAILTKTARFLSRSSWAFHWYILNLIDVEEAHYFIEKLASGSDLSSRNIRDSNIIKLRNKLNNLDRDDEQRFSTRSQDIRSRLIFHVWNCNRRNERIEGQLRPNLDTVEIEKPI